MVVVCYMGAMHTKAVEDFFCDASAANSGFMPFRRGQFYGKYEWDEEDARKLKCPKDFCDLKNLFS